MSLSILDPMYHQFYPFIIAQSITYKSKLSNHYILKKNNNNKTWNKSKRHRLHLPHVSSDLNSVPNIIVFFFF